MNDKSRAKIAVWIPIILFMSTAIYWVIDLDFSIQKIIFWMIGYIIANNIFTIWYHQTCNE